MKLISNRSGELVTHQTQYKYFLPKSLFSISINIDNEMSKLLDEANVKLIKVDELGNNIPDKNIFISMYVQKEAVVSSQIEGTEVSLDDVLQSQCTNGHFRKDIEDVVNYVCSLNQGIKLLDNLPICTRYFCTIHKSLLKGVRGNEKQPGILRTSQNWIGPKNCTLNTASFVPPCPEEMNKCLNDLEKYINNENSTNQFLIDIALIHYQFETIHPFLDGNGRLGRILIPLWLISKKIIVNPILYLSLYFKEHRSQYYSILMDVRFKGEYEKWIKFFLKAIIETSNDVLDSINKIIDLKKSIEKEIVNKSGKNKETLLRAINFAYKQPYFTSAELRKDLNVSKPTVNSIINKLIDFNIIIKKDNKLRNSTYCFAKYINILKPGTEL